MPVDGEDDCAIPSSLFLKHAASLKGSLISGFRNQLLNDFWKEYFDIFIC